MTVSEDGDPIEPDLKIGFIGVGGTGKTSVAEKLIIPEQFQTSISRKAMSDLGIVEADQNRMTAQAVKSLQLGILDAKFRQDDKHPTGLFDRTPLDHLAYTMFRCSESFTRAEYDLLVAKVETYLDKYDVLFFFPLYDWEPPSDGFRQQGYVYRKIIDTLIRHLIVEMDIDVIEVPDDTIEARVDFIQDHILGAREELGEYTDDEEDTDGMAH
jgi:GTPase SAR1 family protein